MDTLVTHQNVAARVVALFALPVGAGNGKRACTMILGTVRRRCFSTPDLTLDPIWRDTLLNATTSATALSFSRHFACLSQCPSKYLGSFANASLVHGVADVPFLAKDARIGMDTCIATLLPSFERNPHCSISRERVFSRTRFMASQFSSTYCSKLNRCWLLVRAHNSGGQI